MFPRLKAIAQDLEKRIPYGVLRYGLVFGSLAVIVGLRYASILIFGRVYPIAVLFMLSYYLLILAAAWLGYIPGVLVCLVTLILIPRLFATSPRAAQFDLVRFGLALVVSLLVSRISQTRHRREDELRRIAQELELRVRERSEEALQAAIATRETEDRLRFVLDSADIGYWDYDVDRDETTRSRKYDEIFGYRESVPLWSREAFLKHVHAEDRGSVDTGLNEALEAGHRSLEFRIVWPDYSVHWVWLQARAHRNSEGRPIHLSGVIQDITLRKQAAESLREQAQLLDLAHDAILSLDWNGTITFWNQGAERMYGWSSAEALGKNAFDLLKSALPESLQDIESQLVSKGHWEGELVHSRRDGSRLRVASRWALRRGSDAEPRGYLEIDTDVTEKHRIEEQLRHTQKLESLGVLAGGVAHDFNNLLTGILGNASLAMEGVPSSQPQRMLLDEVMKAAERAADLTRQLLAYAGKGRFVMRTVDLSELVREIGGLVQASIPKGVQIRLQLANGLPGIDADPGQLQQIIMNLVINGAEAIDSEAGTVLVRTGTQTVDERYIESVSAAGDALRPGEYVCLEVHDTGAGMSEETLSKIFDPFFTTKFAGRGLGLSAVLGIVRAHKGALKVYSQPGRGTTFKVLFPASVKTVSPPPPAARDLTGSGTVLVVDDEEVVRQIARHTLERFGYHALTADDGASAVEIYRSAPSGIALVLLDLTMPVMSGEETLRQLQLINPKVRVLLTSGFNEVETVHRFAGKGLAGFIQKPYTATALAEKVKEVLASRAGESLSSGC